MNESLSFIHELVGRVLKLDPAPLVILFSWALGYVLKAIPQFPNRFIPMACLGLPTFFYPLLVFTEAHPRKIAQDIVLAIIFSGIAWTSHRFVLKPMLDRFLFKGNTGNTEFHVKPKNPDAQQPNKDQ